MDLDIFYKAMLARDYRFDGKFFVAVKTTGIYCRPICPAKPKKENVEFFSSALQAQKAGYRPCLRCHPESAPSSPAWIGKSAIVNRALKYIAGDEFAKYNEEQFAINFGVSARHLRRLFQEEIGMTPRQIYNNNRLDFARKLIVETNICITEIAMISGFSSIRNFNNAIKKRFSKSPREIRKNCKKSQINANIKLFLSYRPPYDWDYLLQFFKSHQIPGIEFINNNTYSRAFTMDSILGAFKVSPTTNGLILEVTNNATKVLFKVAQNVRRMFDLNSDPVLVANAFETSAIMTRLYKKDPGLRLPRGWDPFETSICTILGQLVSTKQAQELVKQLINDYGSKIKNPLTGEDNYIFPTAKTLARVDLKKVKTTQNRKNTIKEFSRLVAEKKIDLICAQSMQILKSKLLEIKGIGPWSAEYIALRALADPNAFPGTDLILKRVLEKHPNMNLDSFAPWKSYAAIYLWKEYAKSLSKKKEKKQ